jgi:hypothetical protein
MESTLNDREKHLESWSAFEREIESLETKQTARSSRLRRHSLFYRGLGNAAWGLQTTLERAIPHERASRSLDYSDYYGEIFGAKHALEAFGKRTFGVLPDPPRFRKLLDREAVWSRGIPQGATGDAIYEYLIYLRHHGFPSPLLDWTRSPYLAAFFAFDAMPRDAYQVAIYIVLRDSMHAHASGRANISFIGPYVAAHPRHFRQQSDYSICLRRVSGPGDGVCASRGSD